MTPLFFAAKMREHALADIEGAFEVDAEHPVVIGLLDRQHAARLNDAGAIHQAIDGAEPGHDFRDRAFAIGRVLDIAC